MHVLNYVSKVNNDLRRSVLYFCQCHTFDWSKRPPFLLICSFSIYLTFLYARLETGPINICFSFFYILQGIFFSAVYTMTNTNIFISKLGLSQFKEPFRAEQLTKNLIQ